MSKVLGQEKPSLEYLVHAGVKGMKWGVRNKKPTDDEILDARYRQSTRAHQIVTANKKAAKSTGAARTAAIKRSRSLTRESLLSEDRVTASRMTSGEKMVKLILYGNLGVAAIGANRLRTANEARKVDRRRAKSSK